MSKAILVIDMPSSCDMCDFVDDSESGKMWCGLPTFGYDVTDCIACKPSDCPLKEVPKKKEHTLYSIGAWNNGYNACIDEILGGNENG